MIDDLLEDADRRMEKSVDVLKHDLATIRTGRASLSLLDNVTADYYGSQTPLNQVANLAIPEASLITITPWEPHMLEVIERAILSSDLGLNPANDGKMLRIPIPPLTEERRKTLVKQVGKLAEEGRTAVRQVRRDVNDRLKRLLKDKEISEDDEKRALKDVQELTDGHIQHVDDLAKAKEKDLMTV